MDETDVAIVGGGIIGLATAYSLLNNQPTWNVVLVEKESRLAAHQSGRNSGVLHSGIYYRPGSLKAQLAVAGREAMICFCSEHGIPFDVCGKVIVAAHEGERSRLLALHDRARANGVRADLVASDYLRALEPHAVGVAALHVPEAGIVDFTRVCFALADVVTRAGAEIRFGWPVDRFVRDSSRTRLLSARGDLSARCAVNCAGLHSDVVARKSAGVAPVRVVPFRGEYHEVIPSREELVNHMIYPVPDPQLPFLGVHLTRGIDGRVHAGPNAVLALAREGYSWAQVDQRDLAELVRFPGFHQLVRRYWRIGVSELARSASSRALARALQRLVPEIRSSDLVRTTAGVRAQALGLDGSLIDDFVITESPGAVHVLNAPSPGATASLEIGREIARRVQIHVA